MQPGADAIGFISCTGTNFLLRSKCLAQANPSSFVQQASHRNKNARLAAPPLPFHRELYCSCRMPVGKRLPEIIVKSAPEVQPTQCKQDCQLLKRRVRRLLVVLVIPLNAIRQAKSPQSGWQHGRKGAANARLSSGSDTAGTQEYETLVSTEDAGYGCPQVGWFPTYTMTEDYALGMELKKEGFHCRYVRDYLALGAPPPLATQQSSACPREKISASLVRSSYSRKQGKECSVRMSCCCD